MPKKDWMVKESDLRDDAQYQVLNATLEKSCIVTGCAGSGKSVLALIKAQRLQSANKDYSVIVFTKSLRNYMEAGRSELHLRKPFTYHWKWQKDGMPKADYIIVDEIQDFTVEEIGEFINAAKKSFFFFGDSAQSIYRDLKPTLPVEAIWLEFQDRVKETNTKRFELYFNYRLPINVARIAQRVGENLSEFVPGVYKSKETQLPYLLGGKNEAEQIMEIVKIIKNRDFQDVGILMPTNEGVKQVQEAFITNGMSVEVKYNEEGQTIDTLRFETQSPKVMTYHSAKGLQFEAVFIPWLPSIIQYRSALYVAMTRTYHFLYLMYSNDMPNVFLNAQSDEYLSSTDIKVEDK